MQDYTGASVWFVKRDGSLIAASTIKEHPGAPSTIKEAQPKEIAEQMVAKIKEAGAVAELK